MGGENGAFAWEPVTRRDLRASTGGRCRQAPSLPMIWMVKSSKLINKCGELVFHDILKTLYYLSSASIYTTYRGESQNLLPLVRSG